MTRRRRNRGPKQRCLLETPAALCACWGPGTPEELQDLVALRRAIREGWDVPQAVRDAIVTRLLDLLDDPHARFRLKVSILQTFVLIGEVEQEEEFRVRRAAKRMAETSR